MNEIKIGTRVIDISNNNAAGTVREIISGSYSVVRFNNHFGTVRDIISGSYAIVDFDDMYQYNVSLQYLRKLEEFN